MKNENKLAYPHACANEQSHSIENGMTMLEAFTMAAMQGLCAGVSGEVAVMDGGENLGQLAFNIAKATLSALETKQEPTGDDNPEY